MLFDLTLEQAQERVLERVRALGEEKAPLMEAWTRILACDVYAPTDIPPFDRSPLDGYALRACDTVKASRLRPISLKVIGTVAAGEVFSRSITAGSAVRIMTGAPIPPGADAVIKQELVEAFGGVVKIFSPLRQGADVAPAGEDVKKGELVLERGAQLNSGSLGLLASLGFGSVRVFRKPRIALLCTGGELIGAEAPLAPGKIRNSNLYTLAAAIREAGGDPVFLGTAPDRVEDIAASLRNGLPTCDLFITTGGVSVGDYDLVPASLEKLGAEIIFHRVAFKPGTPALLAVWKGKLIVGLSGNPGAALLTFELLARPAISLLAGQANWQRPRVKAAMDDSFDKPSDLRRFLRVYVWLGEDGKYRVNITGKQTPGVLKSILGCNALVDVPAQSKPLQKGDEVQVILLSPPIPDPPPACRPLTGTGWML